MTFTEVMITLLKRTINGGLVMRPRGGDFQKSDGGRQNVKGAKFFKHYTLGCANSQKLILLGVLIYKKLYCCIHYFYTQVFIFKNH